MFFRSRRSVSDSPERTMYYLCPDEAKPTGGVKVLYRHVDLLNANGFRAFIVHRKKNFRAEWFENSTAIVRWDDIHPRAQDFVIFPEVYGPRAAEPFRPAKKVVFNQGCYLTFHGYKFDPREKVTPYLDPDVIAALVVSEDSRKYLTTVFPQLRVVRVHSSVDPNLFAYRPAEQKKKLIAFMPNKHPGDAEQVISILKFRGILDDFDVLPIQGKREHEVAEILGDTLVFLSLGSAEGFGLPNVEAMLSGCMVVGYHGGGGREFFKPEFSRPIEINDILGFADAVQGVIEMCRQNPKALSDQTRMACDFVRKEYSRERERDDVVSFWNDTMNSHP
jgi:hypothetical protein